MATNELNTELHRQETSEYCGAACSQMILHQIDNALYPDQTYLYQYLKDHRSEDGWAAEPRGLTQTMIDLDLRPGLTYLLFNEDAAAGFDDAFDKICRKIVWTIYQYKIPPIACVLNGFHWVLVTGYDTTAHPADINDTSYTINKFYINNPAPERPVNPGFVHYMNDDCSTGEGIGSQTEITLEGWKSILTPIAYPSSQWDKKLIAICDPENGPKKAGDVISPKHKFTGETIISPDQAVKEAVLAVNNKKNVSYIKSGKPLLVKRTDRDNDFYYIVPVKGFDNKTNAVIRVDARYGFICEATYAINENQSLKFKTLTPKKIKSLIGNSFYFKKKGVTKIFEEALFINPVLIWKPCRESLNLYYPFYLVLYGSKRIYVRIDGKVFTKLTNPLLGL